MTIMICAVDREALVKTILGKVGNDTPVHAARPLFSADIEQRVYDPDKAAFHYRKSAHGAFVTRLSSSPRLGGVKLM
ncbi:hypothetical protein [Mesorhizobium sp. M1380]|uniref:hypothetical protein n=1 Tax=Mesorhizobium sp. M1380 TaxID=2957093 RepID=UPI0033391A48